jgi:hypothetical protein
VRLSNSDQTSVLRSLLQPYNLKSTHRANIVLVTQTSETTAMLTVRLSV